RAGSGGGRGEGRASPAGRVRGQRSLPVQPPRDRGVHHRRAMRERRSQRPDVLWIAALAAGCAALFARPLATAAGWGVVVAVGVAAFAAVHLRGYGVWSLPVNLAAGALFGWQRWATGRWDSSAVTHAIANLLQSV